MSSENKYNSQEVFLEARPERRLIPQEKSFRHVDFRIRVADVPVGTSDNRMPLTLALVLDRSGSMQGQKLVTAKYAAQAVVDRLDERDHIAVVVFDDRVDIVQRLTPVTSIVKSRIKSALSEIQARASTALYEGWLTGCQAIADDAASPTHEGLARCFLLTDGLANVGLTDPEQIASEAASIRDKAGIGTSTFGIGADYDESLLAPMAVAGGGQFHHLRSPQEIANTFIGELGDLLTVAASQVRLEVEIDADVTVEVISEYWVSQSGRGSLRREMIAIGDLLSGEERHVVVRFGFPHHGWRDPRRVVRARILWTADGVEHSTAWQDVLFSYADDRLCSAETNDVGVIHWVGLHHAQRAKKEAMEQRRHGRVEEARQKLSQTAQRIMAYAVDDKELEQAAEELNALESDLIANRVDNLAMKEHVFAAQACLRGQKDLRNS